MLGVSGVTKPLQRLLPRTAVNRCAKPAGLGRLKPPPGSPVLPVGTQLLPPFVFGERQAFMKARDRAMAVLWLLQPTNVPILTMFNLVLRRLLKPIQLFQEANLEPSIQSLRRTRDLDPGGRVYIAVFKYISNLSKGSTLLLTSRLGVGTSARSMDIAKPPPFLVMVFKTKRFAMRLGLGLTKPLGGKLFGKRT